MEKDKPFTPAEAFKNFFENTSFTDMLWLIITVGVGYLLYLIARRQYRKNSFGFIDLVVWGIVTLFCVIVTYFIFSYTISKGGYSSWGYYSICLLVSFLAVYAANKDIYKYQRLIIGLIIIIIGGCLFASFIAGEQAIMYAIMFGVLQGGSSQLFLTTVLRYLKSLKDGTASREEAKETKATRGGKV